MRSLIILIQFRYLLGHFETFIKCIEISDHAIDIFIPVKYDGIFFVFFLGVEVTLAIILSIVHFLLVISYTLGELLTKVTFRFSEGESSESVDTKKSYVGHTVKISSSLIDFSLSVSV